MTAVCLLVIVTKPRWDGVSRLYVPCMRSYGGCGRFERLAALSHPFHSQQGIGAC
jgi:hypothetical protein